MTKNLLINKRGVNMGAFWGLISLVGFIICLVAVIISARNQNIKSKPWVIGLVAFLAVSIICLSLPY